MKSNDERARKCNGAIEALEELFPNSSGKASIYHRYVLVQRASGELVFEQEEFDFYLEQAIAAQARGGLPAAALERLTHAWTQFATA